jgi:hypothetical protein
MLREGKVVMKWGFLFSAVERQGRHVEATAGQYNSGNQICAPMGVHSNSCHSQILVHGTEVALQGRHVYPTLEYNYSTD